MLRCSIQQFLEDFQGLFKGENEVLEKFLDEQTIGNQDCFFSNWKCTDVLNARLTLEEIIEEALKTKSDKATGPDGIMDTYIKLGFQHMQRPVFLFCHLCFPEYNVTRN